MGKQKLKRHIIEREWCKGCGICVAFCPKQVLALDREEKAVAERPEACICCRLFELRCPDLAIEIITEDDGGDPRTAALAAQRKLSQLAMALAVGVALALAEQGVPEGLRVLEPLLRIVGQGLEDVALPDHVTETAGTPFTREDLIAHGLTA